MISADIPPDPVAVEEKPFLRFPPWPKPIPQLGELISFDQFQPLGLLPPYAEGESDSDEEGQEDGGEVLPKGYKKLEVDGAGIPTVDIHVNHDPSRHDKYRRKASKGGILRVDSLFGIDGLEPVGTRRNVPYDSLLHPLTRVYRSTKEWEVSRKFVLNHSYNNVWNHFIKYAQIVKPFEKQVEEDIIFEDDDDEIVEDENGFIPHPEPDSVSPEEGGECRFLKDIVGTMRIWLSFEFKDSGLAWLDKQLEAAALVTKSYLKYLLAHGVLPERISELEEAVRICEMAEKDMLATKDVAVAFQDGFNKLCSRLLGTASVVERNNGWSSSAPGPEPSSESNEDPTDLAHQVKTLALDDNNGDDASHPSPPTDPLLFLSTPTTDLPPSSADKPTLSEVSDSESGWSLSPSEPLHSLTFAPPLATTSSTSLASADMLDNGGWGVSPSHFIDPRTALFGSDASSQRVPFLTHPEASYLPHLPGEMTLLRIVSVPPQSSSDAAIDGHELGRAETGLTPIVAEKWVPAVEPFGSIIASESSSAQASSGVDEGKKVVLWVEEERVRGKVRPGMGLFGRVVWVGKKKKGEEGGGFWFVDVVEEVIAEYWLAPEKMRVE